MSLLDIYIKHNDWEGTCFFKDNKIYRKCNIEEYGNYNIKNNTIFQMSRVEIDIPLSSYRN